MRGETHCRHHREPGGRSRNADDPSDRGCESDDAQNAHQSDGGGIESLGNKLIHAALLGKRDTKVGHVSTPFLNSSRDTCTASYHVTQGTLQYILSVSELFVAPRYRTLSVANQ